MKSKLLIAAAVAALLTPLAASAQFLGKEEGAVTANKMEGTFWSPKPSKAAPMSSISPGR